MSRQHDLLGIDVGKGSLMLAFPPDAPKTPFNRYPTLKLDYGDARWWVTLIDLCAQNAIVAAEPTGHHLLAPVAAVLEAYRPDVQLWRIEHALSGNYRTRHISSAKNDRLDAIAILLIAQDIAAGQPPRGARPYDFFLESAVQRLRMLVNAHARLTKESTRAKNRLNVLAHSMFPALAGSSTWERAARLGIITPAELKAFAPDAAAHPIYADGRTRRYLINLAADLPDIESDPATRIAIVNHFADLTRVEDQLATIENDIRAVITLPPFATVTRRWMTLPNWNAVQLAAIHVATRGSAATIDKDQFRAALGVSPKTSISGDADRTRNTRRGFRPARAAVHMWAVNLTSPNAASNAVRDYYFAAEARTFAAAKNKLARVLWGTARNERLDQRPTAPSAEQADELPAV